MRNEFIFTDTRILNTNYTNQESSINRKQTCLPVGRQIFQFFIFVKNF